MICKRKREKLYKNYTAKADAIAFTRIDTSFV